jgi:predicted PurR-regulated permease PerM
MATPDQPPEWMGRVPVVGDELEGYWVKFADARKHWIERLDVEVVKAEKKKAEEEKAQPPRPKIVVETEDGLMVKEPPLPAGELQAKGGGEPEDVEAESQHVVAMLGKLLVSAKDWLIKLGLAVGQGVTQVLLSAFLAFFLLRDAPVLAERLAVAVERLAGQRGRHLIKVAGNTVRGVIFGILATAIAQAVAAGLGFWIAGVPGAVLLAVLTFFFAVVPFGPPMIWIPAAIWLFSQDRTGWGIFMLVWGLLGISSVDNVLRPFIISHGSKMPFALIFCGVIGGALAFGLVGVFLGPTLLAVAFRLIEEWSSSQYAARDESTGDAISELPDEA